MKFEQFVGQKHQEWIYDYQTHLKIMQKCPNFQFHVCAFCFLFLLDIGYHPIIYVQLKVNIYKMI